MKHIRVLPGKAECECEGPHDCDFILENMPESVAGIVRVVVLHLKAWL
jgi:hypothetical protein